MPKKLIEVALPLKAINAESVREKSIRHGHPSTLHLWWARRPLAAARAVIFSSLIDDPSSLPDEYPTEEAQGKRRQELFALIEKLVKWENSNNEKVLDEAKAEIRKSVGGKPLALLDPFAGGGSIPLEAQRLGLEAHAHDLNPVAVIINKAMIEIPPKFAGQPPVRPSRQAELSGATAQWKGAAGLAEDVRYYGQWMKQEAFRRIGHLYPKIKVPGGGEATVIAWIWARTVKCPNPACGCEMPLASSFVLSKKKGKEAYIQPIIHEADTVGTSAARSDTQASAQVGARASGPSNENIPPTQNEIRWRSRGYHPHIDGASLIQHITFRLADSLPASLIQQWKAELGITQTRPPEDKSLIELRQRVEKYEDSGYGACHLLNADIARIVQDALLHFDGERYRLIEWCVMPNHVHVLIQTKPEYPLSGVVQSWKSFTAKKANGVLGTSGEFWQYDYYDRFIRNEEHLGHVRTYIQMNPVKAGLVDQAERWQWGSGFAGFAGVPPAGGPAARAPAITYEVRSGKNAPEPPKTARGAKFKCVKCGGATTPDYIKDEAMAGHMGAHLMAVVAEGNNGRIYLAPDEMQRAAAHVARPDQYPDGELPENTRWFSPPVFCLTHFSHLFTPRQLTALTTFSALVKEAQQKVKQDALTADMKNDRIPLAEGGTGAMAYGQAIGVYLAFVVDKLSDLGNSLNRWEPNAECPRQLFARQAIPMVWDYAEGNVFSNSSGSWSVLLDNLRRSFHSGLFDFERSRCGTAVQHDAQTDNSLRNIIVSTDPPYYDNIGYADLSDFFYIWVRQSLKDTYPEIFRTMLVPKAEELVATPYRFEGSKEKARDFFEDGMLQAFQRLYYSAHDDIPVTIYYAFKQSEADEDDSGDQQTASTGWETMLSAIIRAGFAITGTWPIRTEMGSRAVAQSTNALASSIVLVCRKRPANAPNSTRRDFISALKRELRPALAELQKANIAPVDLAQSAIGPGMAVYSRFAKVLEADGGAMGVRGALAIINQELDLFFTEQDGELDAESRFCLDLYSQFAFNEMKFGEADVLARAKNTAVDKLAAQGVLLSQKGIVRLLERTELPDNPKAGDKILWMRTQQLTRALETGGVVACAEIVASPFGDGADRAKALAYRLFTIAEQKGWAQEALAYNSLVIAWPEIQEQVVRMKDVKPVPRNLF